MAMIVSLGISVRDQAFAVPTLEAAPERMAIDGFLKENAW